jgi:drug/metabolite transporter (DMT)-like permease
MDVAAIALGLGAAFFLAVGFVVQQHAAAEEPPDERLSFRLLLHLVRRPLWVAGIGAMIVGQLLGAAALSQGSLALVEPVMAANLLFALPLAAIWRRCKLGPREWLGAVSLLGGLTAFVVAGDPYGGHTTKLPWPNWVIAAGAIALTGTAFVVLGRRASGAKQATLWACAAGTLYGLQDALTQRTLAGFSHGIGAALVSWPLFLLVFIAVVALLIGQSAFEAAPLAASLPAITVAEPITGIAFGVGVYSEHLALGWPYLLVELLGVAAMIVGVLLVARSPLVTGDVHQAEPMVDRAA